MPAPEESNTKKTAGNFPYKTLIWAVFALAALFLFKGELKSMLLQADEVAIFGIELKVGKEKAVKLESAIQGYEDQIAEFNEQITKQQEHIKGLEKLQDRLEDDIASCPEARENAKLLNMEYAKIFKANTDLQKQTDVLKNTKILQRMKVNNLKLNQ